jgi:putative ABC transport system permease protein
MTAISQALATIRRRPLRTFLTALGTALGIATIVALLAISDGAQQSAGKFFNLGPSDLGLFQASAADPTTSVLPTSLIAKLKATPGIADATPLILLLGDIKGHKAAIAFGADPNGFLSRRIVFLQGHMFQGRDQAIIGDTFSSQSHIPLGATLTVAGHPLKVVGIYHLGVSYQDSGAFVPLKTAQAIAGKPDEATTIAAKLDAGTKPAAAKRTLTHRFPGLEVISDSDEAVRAGVNAQLLSKMTLVLAVLALVIGGVWVMNTMLMAVIERRAEFALLSAVGWSGPQIAGRVMAEGVLTTTLGAALGLLLGTVGAQLLVHALGAQEFVAPDITAWDLGRGLLVGVLLGVLSGLYPAWRAARVSPAAVLAQR